jgi:hypothetical protein
MSKPQKESRGGSKRGDLEAEGERKGRGSHKKEEK